MSININAGGIERDVGTGEEVLWKQHATEIVSMI